MPIAFSKPIWSAGVAGLLIRLPLGFYFLYAGRVKLLDPNGFIETVKGFGILPDQLATVYGVLLPYAEIMVGVLLVLGLWTTLAAIMGSAMLASFIVALRVFPFSENPYLLNKDVLLLGSCMSLLAIGAGTLSVDGFRQS